MRPAVVDPARKLHSVERAGHVDVGEQQSHFRARFEHPQGGLGVGRLEDAEAVFLRGRPRPRGV